MISHSLFRSKAVANGAVLHFIDRTVRSRVSKASYGTMCHTYFSPLLSAHREREHLAQLDPITGRVMIGPLFVCLVQKVRIRDLLSLHRNYDIVTQGSKVDTDKISEERFFRSVTNMQSARNFKTSIYRFDGDGIIPRWYSDFRGWSYGHSQWSITHWLS